MVPTDEHKERFLISIRAGADPAEAARLVHPEFTASCFKRLTNEGNTNYDVEFSADYLRARAEGTPLRRKHNGEQAKPSPTTAAGFVKAAYITPEMIESFLDAVSSGVPIVQACESIEPKTSLSQLHRRANKDPEFAKAYADAKEDGYPLFVQKLKDEAVRQAYNGDYRALRDQLLIHDKEFRKVLLASKHEITGADGEAIKLIAAKALPDLPPQMLDALIESMEQKQIEAAN
jgi:hypothetical protein